MRHRVQSSRRKLQIHRSTDLSSQANNILAQRMEFERRALELKTEGYKTVEIAEIMNLRVEDVPALLLAGLEEYRSDRNNAIERYIALTTARYDRILREWWPRALGRTERIKDEEGNVTEIYHPGDPVATKMVLKVMSDSSKMLGLNKMKVEHTGKDGGAIAATIDITQIPSDLIEKFLRTGDRSILTPGFVNALPARSQGSSGAGAEETRTRKD